MRRSGIYAWWNSAADKLYVGSAKNLVSRQRSHVASARRGAHRNRYFQRAWNKYGEASFHFFVLEECEVEELVAHEQVFIDLLRTADPRYGYNLAPKAGSNLGVRYSDETRARISEIAKNRPPPTPETLQRMREAQLGRIHSDAAKAKIGLGNRGKRKPWSEEMRASASRSRTGKKRGKYSSSAAETARRNLAKANAAALAKGLLIQTEKGLVPSPKFRELISAKGRGRRHSPETREKMKGRIVSSETRAKLSQALRGKERAPFSEEHRRNMSKARVGKKRPPRDRLWAARISRALTGKQLSAEHKAKIAAAGRGRIRKAESNAKMVSKRRSKGAWHTPETIEKMRKTKAARTMKIRELIEEVLRSEDPLKPLNDEQIVAELDARGLKVSRRTVGKHPGRPPARAILRSTVSNE